MRSDYRAHVRRKSASHGTEMRKLGRLRREVLGRPSHLLSEQCAALASLVTRAQLAAVPRPLGEPEACLRQPPHASGVC